MRALGLKSPAPVQNRLSKLHEKGFISWTPGIPRSIQVLRPGHEWVLVPKPLLLEIRTLVARWEARQSAAAKYDGVSLL